MSEPPVVWRTAKLPFAIGASPTPQNQHGLPDALPFTLAVDPTSGLLVQIASDEIDQALEAAYKAGSIIGTPMDDTGFGLEYTESFLAFITRTLGTDLSGRRTLEIGPGRGYLMRRMGELGATVVGLEPGTDKVDHWRRHGVEVVQGFFPDARVTGTFDAIVAHGVLEHITDARAFLEATSAQLGDDGVGIFAVPDCAPYLAAGDPSMLVHEHFSYFDAATFERFLQAHGFAVREISPATYGGLIYAAFTRARGHVAGAVSTADPTVEGRRYGAQVEHVRRYVASEVSAIKARGQTLGIYCAARGLSLLPTDQDYRFFDDDPALLGLFLPPFTARIEGRAALAATPVDELWILSMTFGEKLAAELAHVSSSSGTRTRLLADLVHTAVQGAP